LGRSSIWKTSRRGLEGSEGWAIRYLLQDPPELTAEISSRRWEDINLLLHSLMLFPGELRGRRRNPFLAILRSAITIVNARRGLLYLQKPSGRSLVLTDAFGFGERIPERLRAGNSLAVAAIRLQKPILVSDPPEEALRRELRLLGHRSCMTVPVLKRGMPWCALQLVRVESFQQEEAILLWIYALILDGFLPGLVESTGSPEPALTSDEEPGLVDRQHFESSLIWEIERSSWTGRPCSLLQVRWRPIDAQGVSEPDGLRSRQVLRAIRLSLRPVDLIAMRKGGDLLVSLPGLGSSLAQEVMQEIRRDVLQTRALGEREVVRHSLRLAVVTCPVDGNRVDQLLRAVESLLDGTDAPPPAVDRSTAEI
jgi:hypothetical protein